MNKKDYNQIISTIEFSKEKLRTDITKVEELLFKNLDNIHIKLDNIHINLDKIIKRLNENG